MKEDKRRAKRTQVEALQEPITAKDLKENMVVNIVHNSNYGLSQPSSQPKVVEIKALLYLYYNPSSSNHKHFLYMKLPKYKT